jgi:hypothetical protein
LIPPDKPKVAHSFGDGLPAPFASGKWSIELALQPSDGICFYARETIDAMIPGVGNITHRRVNTRFTPAQSAALQRLAAAAIEAMTAVDAEGNPL